jgi:hypothetical protein
MKTTFKIIIYLIFALIGKNTVGQSLSLQLVGSLPDTVYIGQTININANLVNVGIDSFNSVINFSIENAAGFDISSTGFFGQPPYTDSTITLAPLESIPAFFTVEITPASYAVNSIDIITIWPSTIFVARDSIKKIIFIKDTSDVGIDDKALAQAWVSILPNYFVFKNPDLSLVELLSIDGRTLTTYHNPNTTEPMPKLVPGIYCLNMTARGNSRRLLFTVR